jgi:hypothetical protein
MVQDYVRLPFVPAAGILNRLSNFQLTSHLGSILRTPPARTPAVQPTSPKPVSSPALPISGPTLVFAYGAMSALWNKNPFTTCPVIIASKLTLNISITYPMVLWLCGFRELKLIIRIYIYIYIYMCVLFSQLYLEFCRTTFFFFNWVPGILPVRRTENLATFMCRLSKNLGASTSWNPQGLSRPVMGLFYLTFFIPHPEI